MLVGSHTDTAAAQRGLTWTERQGLGIWRMTGIPGAYESAKQGNNILRVAGAGAWDSPFGYMAKTTMALGGVSTLGHGDFALAESFAFEKTGAIGDLFKKGAAMPYAYRGDIFTGVEGRMAEKMGMSAGKGLGLRGATRLLGPLTMIPFGISAARRGWQEGGVFGAAKELGKEAAFFAATDIAIQAAGPFWPVLLTQGIGAAKVIGDVRKARAAYYQSRPLGLTGPMDAFNTRSAYTMRQRSMMQIQNSHLNARSALGSEARTMHISTLRMA